MINYWKGMEVEDLQALIDLAAQNDVSKLGLIKEIRNGCGFDLMTTKKLVELNPYYSAFDQERPSEGMTARDFVEMMGLSS